MPLAVELDELATWVERLPSIGMETLGGAGASMYILDFVMIGAVKRSLSLASGMQSMVQAQNMVCSRAILRMQLDTVSRLLAYSYVKDPEAMAKALIGGTPIKKFKSRDGKPLVDGYLIDQMTQAHPWARKVYDFTSGYVHFSEKQFFDSIQSIGSDQDRTIQLQVSHIDNQFPEFSWEETVACFNELLKIIQSLLGSYSSQKTASSSKNTDVAR